MILLLTLAACGEAVKQDHFANQATEEAAEAPAMSPGEFPVRIGELGPNFPACSAAGTTRNVDAGETLAVRAAPFDNAEETGRIASGSRFLICNRSHDQKWFGIVYDEAENARRCGVSAPVTSARAYEGPCRSGWVLSALVKLTASAEQPQMADSEGE
ncbi:MAG TPA: hypothetical protein VNT77_07460 [Allosphingosinicella sp.]|nr:hypothetical protein [Allosphingosinicella sp.]